MVAIIGGNGLGLNASSLGSLGRFGLGQTGTAALGQSGERAYVDVANGNLVVQNADALLAGLGLDVTDFRTYNSQGGSNFTNNDGWMNGQYKSLVNLGGGVLRRTDSDGSTTDYVWNATSQTYVENYSPSGAVDTIKSNAEGTFTWTSGATGATETYQGSGLGLITGAKDANGNALTFSYSGNLLTGVKTADGESILFSYTGNNLTGMTTTGTSGQVLTRVTYGYDTSNRLTLVSVTLNPLNQSQVSSGNVLTSYLTTYTYDGASNRVASITQSDGTTVAFTYVLANGSYRVATVTDGNGAITQLSYNTATSTTTVTDPYGVSSVYVYDAKGQLTQIKSGVTAGNTAGLTQVNYTYNNLGEIATITDGLGRIITLGYDTLGNLISQVDSAGDMVSWTYNARNQVQTETRYATPANGVVVASQPMTTRYVYSATNATLLRYVISAEGNVTERQYNAQGLQTSAISYTVTAYSIGSLGLTAVPTEAQMQTWASALDLSQTQRTDLVYDFRGQLQKSTTYGSVYTNGIGIAATATATQYVYDQRGELLQTLQADGKENTLSVYDGLGRLVYTQLRTTTSRTLFANTITQYDDVHGKVTLTLANGLATASTFDHAGRLVSTVQLSGTTTLGTTQYEYDQDGRLLMVTDPSGKHAWAIYDAAGRKVGDIDAAGGLTEYVYDPSNQITETIRYATAVNTASLLDVNGKAATSLSGTATLASLRPASNAADQKAWSLYDSTGRLAWQVDGMGNVTQTNYDGASRVISVTHYATAINASMMGDGIGVTLGLTGTNTATVQTSANDRVSTRIYNNAGLLRATIDGEGYLTEYKYNGADQLVQTTAYVYKIYGFTDAASIAARVDAARSSDSLAGILPYQDVTRDISTYTIYGSKGQVVGQVDGEGYLTEITYDPDGRVAQTKRYATKVTATVTPSSTLADLRSATQAEDQVTTNTWDGLGRLATQANAEGTITQYTYDAVGQVLTKTTALNTSDQRKGAFQYDVQGRVTASLSGVGAALLTGVVANDNAVWAQYATTYAYDAAGRQISQTDPLGHKSVYFYDDAGRVRFTVDATGEVTETQYDALGHVANSTKYATALTGTNLSGLVGGLLSATANATAVTALAAAKAASTKNSTTTLSYNTLGELTRSIQDAIVAGDGLGGTATWSYNAFGEVSSTTQSISGTQSLTNTRGYDRRGLLTDTLSDQGVWNLTTYAVYDAFGRMTYSQDARGNTTQTSYDRLGRTVAVTDPLGKRQSISYDAFSRVLTQTDALNHATSYAYDTANRKLTMTTAEGVVIETVHTRNGQTLSVKDGNGNTTTYKYDQDGHLLETDLPAGLPGLGFIKSLYDKAGNLQQTTDNNGNVVAYTYDAVNRLFTRTVDAGAGKLNLLTTYGYDAKGNGTTVTDANQVVTKYDYDLKGEVLTQTVDPTGLNIQTVYNYDQRGKVLTVTTGKTATETGTTTQYVYDDLGRRVQSITDPGTGHLNLTTQYFYDMNGNVGAVIDPNGAVTRYTYDTDNRLVHTADGAGSVAKNLYDDVGRLITVLRYTVPVDLSNGPQVLSVAVVDGAVAGVNGQSSIAENRVYDADNRLTYSVDGAGSVTQFKYDANGNVVDRINYATRIVLGSWTAGTTPSLTVDPAHDQEVRTIYDAANRAIYTLSSTGDGTQVSVVVNTYDGNGNVVARTAYADAIAAPSSTATASVLSSAVNALIAAQTTTPNASNATIRRVYDAANRLTYSVDGAGSVTQFKYDANGNVVDRIGYATRIVLGNWTAGTAPTLTADQAHDQEVRMVYDAANRAIYTLSSTETGTQVAVVVNTYDGNGNVVARTAYADAITAPASTATTAVLSSAVNALITAQIATPSVSNATVHRVYDAANRLTWSVNSAGAVTQQVFDANGNLIKQVAYASAIAAGAAPSSVVAVAGMDRATFMAYDAAGRMVYQVNALGDVTQKVYDTLGHAMASIAYATPLSAETNAGTPPYTVAALAGLVQASTDTPSLDRVTLATYDAAGLQVFGVDATGAVTQLSYDALGHVIATTTYSKTIAAPTAASALLAATPATSPYTPTKLQVGGAAGLVATAESDRTTCIAYDAAGHQVYKVDALGIVTENKFDALGRVTKTVLYSQAVTGVSIGTTGSAIKAKLPSLPSSTVDRVTGFVYDAAGNLSSSTDAAGFPESYTYDGVGNKITFTNKNNALWSYDYDAAGRMTKETSPQVNVTTLQQNAATGVLSELSTTSVAIVTLLAYDALGNLTSRTEADGSASVRTTSYQYDALGHQIQTTYPSVGVYNAADLANLAIDGSGSAARTETTQPLMTKVFYNIFGEAVINIDVAGKASSKVYDKLGHVVYDIDALGYLTQYDHNAFGDTKGLTRYSNTITLSANIGLGAAYAPTQAGAATAAAGFTGEKRVITTDFDQLGRAVQVTQPATWVNDSSGGAGYSRSAITRISYNAFGEVTQTKVLAKAPNGLNGTETWAVTNNYYDLRGQLAVTVDRMGYVTTRTYDGAGNLMTHTEFAVASSGWVPGSANPGPVTPLSGPDRTMKYSYDLVNRKLTETQLGVAYSVVSDGRIETPGNLVTSYTYDHVGNLISTTDALGNQTLTAYDALGRITSVQSAAQGGAAGRPTLTPVTEFKRDAFGDVVIRVDRALIGGSAARATYTAYDRLGHATEVTYALGINHFMSYDAAGRLAKTWQAVTGNDSAGNPLVQTLYTAFTYDDLGRQTSLITPATTSVPGTSITGDTLHDGSAVTTQTQALAGSVTTGMKYNAFGEVTNRGSYATGAPAQYQESFEYDPAGRVWRTRAQDGQVTVVLYDLQGQQTAQITSAGSTGSTTSLGINLGDYVDASAVDALDAATGGVRRFDFTRDLLGRVISQTLPFRADSTWVNGRPEVFQTFDRWGNMLTQSDVRSSAWITQYTYNFRNQVTSQTQPDGNGQITQDSPVTRFYYDAVGQQVAVRDARDQVNGRAWDAGGHLVAEFHADGGIITHDYDEFGEQTQLTDAEGHLTQYRYDALGRNTSVTRAGTLTHAGVGIYRSADGLTVTGGDTQNLVTKMEYDEAGHKVAETVNFVDGDPTTGFTTRYAYDLRGNVIATTDPLNRVKKAAFDLQGRQIGALDGLGSLNTWTYDPTTGQLTRHDWSWVVTTRTQIGEEIIGYDRAFDDMGNPIYDQDGNFVMVPVYGPVWQDSYAKFTTADTFSYDNAQQVLTQATVLADGQKLDRSYAYDAAGEMTQSVDVSTSAGGVATTKTSTYAYNAAGQHTHEGTVQGGVTYQDQLLAYDKLGRLIKVESALDGTKIQYTFDKVGNKISQVNTYNVMVQTGETDVWGWVLYSAPGVPSNPPQVVYGDKPPIEHPNEPGDYSFWNYEVVGSEPTYGPEPQTKTLYFAYDEMNRQILVDGLQATTQMDPDKISRSLINQDQGHILTYDKNGNRTSDTTYGTQITTHYTVSYNHPIVWIDDPLDPLDQRINWEELNWEEDTSYTSISYSARTGVGTTFYAYDAMDRLSTVSVGSYDQDDNLLAQSAAFLLDKREYDGASRMVAQGSPGTIPAAYLNAVGSNTNNSGVTSTVNRYDAAGQLLSQHVTNKKDASGSYDASYWYDVAGNMTVYRVFQGPVTTSFDTALTMVYGSYKDASVTEGISANGTSSSGTVSKTYDAGGMLIGVTDPPNSANNRTLVNDASGHVLQKIQGGYISRELVANGEVLAQYDAKAAAAGTPWNFDLAYTPVTNSYPAAATGNYSVQSGDTLKGIAQAAYGDSTLWYVIAEANGLSGDQDLRVGQVLTVPNRVGNIHNSATTHSAYDPSKIVGSTTPNLPIPQATHSSGGGCGGLGQFIMIVVAVVVTAVVTYYMGPTAGQESATFFDTVITGATAAAAGSAASQEVGIAIGAQDDFSWDQVGMAAIGGAVSGGINGVNGAGGISSGPLSGTQTAAVMGRAAISNAVTQGIEIAVGLQDHFSWTGVAASAVGAGVGSASNDFLSKSPAFQNAVGSDFGGKLAQGTLSGFAAGLTTSAMRGGRIDVVRVATDAFGNALGSSLATSNQPEEPSVTTNASVKMEELQALQPRDYSAFADLVPGVAPTLAQDEQLGQSDNPYQLRLHVAGRGDSYASVASQYYGDERYAGLLMRANGVDPTYANIHDLQVGANLATPDFSGLSDDQLGMALRVGGAIISGDQRATDAIAAWKAESQAQARWNLSQEHADQIAQDQQTARRQEIAEGIRSGRVLTVRAETSQDRLYETMALQHQTTVAQVGEDLAPVAESPLLRGTLSLFIPVPNLAIGKYLPEISGVSPTMSNYLWAGGIGGGVGGVFNVASVWANGRTPTVSDFESGVSGGVVAGVTTLASSSGIAWMSKSAGYSPVVAEALGGWFGPGFGTAAGQLTSDRMDATLQPSEFRWDNETERNKAVFAFGVGVAAGRLFPDGGLAANGVRLDPGRWYASQTVSPVVTGVPVIFGIYPEPPKTPGVPIHE